MEKNQYLMPVIIVLVVIIALILALSVSGNNTFNTGTVSFQYPNSWSQDSLVGNFSNSSTYSSVTLTTNYADSNGKPQPTYIVLQMQEKATGSLNLPSTNNILLNTTNSSVASTTVNNITASQVGSVGNNIASKYTIIDKDNNYYLITYICPRFALNQTEQAYNNLLQTLKIS
ncbi:MAG: hypothetical protein NKF70_04990 [Methanobacterium sp. ERen5]|nr:MAG: hypothetical protein NKF70_04990 [Methanobacterium sp. ERen5]